MVNDNNNNNSERANAIIQDLAETLENNKIRKFCDNELVNIIMINKYDTIKANHIEFSSNLNVPNNINIKNTDLCRLFTNIVDNAIESCVSSNDKSKVFIILSSQIKDNNFGSKMLLCQIVISQLTIIFPEYEFDKYFLESTIPSPL